MPSVPEETHSQAAASKHVSDGSDDEFERNRVATRELKHRDDDEWEKINEDLDMTTVPQVSILDTTGKFDLAKDSDDDDDDDDLTRSQEPHN